MVYRNVKVTIPSRHLDYSLEYYDTSVVYISGSFLPLSCDSADVKSHMHRTCNSVHLVWRFFNASLVVFVHSSRVPASCIP